MVRTYSKFGDKRNENDHTYPRTNTHSMHARISCEIDTIESIQSVTLAQAAI